ncbi:MAG: alanyl aminopeptidase [Bacteroidetes bacterium]|nr:MAG: alanyl aminopeptidase [Bacteroidota bacterium]PTM13023.1 MAG: alanyl aminopeptidase [Bacteroidota bacterium]
MYRYLAGLGLLSLIVACGTPRVVTIAEPAVAEVRQLDTLVITAPPIEEDEKVYALPVYNASFTQTNDLLHTRLNLSFDWEKEQVMGKATLDLKPYFYPTDLLVLDAKGFTFKNISLGGTALKYSYDDNRQVVIKLPRTYTRDEKYTVVIDYVATPRADGGSNAITSDKGLFFINPRGEDPGKPQQIWTQGETENNSRWFPTIDKPNERCTEEIYLTVADKYVTLSNGVLVSSTKNPDGTRTDYWKMDQPHAPYLFMLTVGEFAVVNDAPWNGKPVSYYVEPAFEKDAKAIFPHTPEMLTFFSDVLGVPYPWAKFSQVVVRDYVSGAMENTTAVIFGEFMQHTERELIDELMNDKIVAHEMFHHWFGDYVTCESWANLTLNEGFANYSEYLWLEHQYGRDEADAHLLEEWDGYLSSAQEGIHPLIDYGYADKENMFDAHSYNKGGAVLHMLRKIIGDEAFFAGLQHYLELHAYSAVEVDELRMAFEDVTGQDLNWFFDQWYLQEGHPSLSLSYDYDAATQEAIVLVKQTQDGRKMSPIYQLPLPIDVYLPGQSEPTRHQVLLLEREQTFRLPASQEPALVNVDAERSILAEWSDAKSADQLAYQFIHAPLFLDRFQALATLAGMGDDQLTDLLLPGLQDPYHGIRALALENISATDATPELMDVVAGLAENDPHSEVRATALSMLASLGYPGAQALATKALQAESYAVVAAGLGALVELDPAAAQQAANQLQEETNSEIVATIGGIYATSNEVQYLPYFSQHLSHVDGYAAFDFYESFSVLLLVAEPAALLQGAQELQAIGTDMGQSPWRRLSAVRTLSQVKGALLEKGAEATATQIADMITAIKAAETNPQLQGIYQQF